jgi:hypothetical protein
MKSPRSRRALAALTIVLAGPLMAGCSGDESPGEQAATSTSVPSQGSTGNPFASTLEGPETGEPGDTLTETLTNTGRLPDAYQIAIEPTTAATVEESNFSLSPGESVEVQIRVRKTPFEVHVKSVGGGAPDRLALTVS